MKQAYIEEYIQLSPEEMKKNLFGTRILVGIFGGLTFIGLFDHHSLQTGFAISLIIFFLCGWIISKNMANYLKSYFLYSGIGFLWVSVFNLIKIVLQFEKMFHLDMSKLMIAYGTGYLFTLVMGTLYFMWALQRGGFTENYKKKHIKRNAFFTGLASIIPGGMLIINSVMKYIFGADLFYKGLSFAVSFIPFLILFLAIPFLHKYYLIKKYQVRVERVFSDESVGR